MPHKLSFLGLFEKIELQYTHGEASIPMFVQWQVKLTQEELRSNLCDIMAGTGSYIQSVEYIGYCEVKVS